MVDRVVVLHADDGLSFIADACAVMAAAVNETRLVTSGHADLVEAYTEMVVAFARLVRPRLLDDGETVRVAVMDHPRADRSSRSRPCRPASRGTHPGPRPGLTRWDRPACSHNDEASQVGFPSLTAALRPRERDGEGGMRHLPAHCPVDPSWIAS